MTRNEAFELLINKTDWHLLCGINPTTARSYKKRFLDELYPKKKRKKEPKKVSVNKVEELLLLAGAKHKSSWSLPKSWKINK